jgi:uncharacterized repeat protein (TIGR04138 family)
MASQSAVDIKIRELVREKPQFGQSAYHFVFEALDFTMLRLGKHRRRGEGRHLTVDELLEGVREFAISQYGPLARVVLESMAIYRTEDFGEVVFNLVDKGLLNKQDSDSPEQFKHGFSFREAFDHCGTREPSL